MILSFATISCILINYLLQGPHKNVKIQNAKHLEVVEEEAENAEVVISTLIGLPESWESFIREMCAGRR